MKKCSFWGLRSIKSSRIEKIYVLSGLKQNTVYIHRDEELGYEIQYSVTNGILVVESFKLQKIGIDAIEFASLLQRALNDVNELINNYIED